MCHVHIPGEINNLKERRMARPVDVERVKQALRDSWTRETCYPGCVDEWRLINPSFGQCAVTALILQNYINGELLYCAHNHHYWNRTPGQEEIDLTKDQFPAGTIICLDEVKPRDYLLFSEAARKVKTKERYLLLRERVERILKR